MRIYKKKGVNQHINNQYFILFISYRFRANLIFFLIYTCFYIHLDFKKDMKTIEFREALREALNEEMRRDESVFLMGEEVAEYNGA